MYVVHAHEGISIVYKCFFLFETASCRIQCDDIIKSFQSVVFLDKNESTYSCEFGKFTKASLGEAFLKLSSRTNWPLASFLCLDEFNKSNLNFLLCIFMSFSIWTFEKPNRQCGRFVCILRNRLAMLSKWREDVLVLFLMIYWSFLKFFFFKFFFI